MKHLHGLLNKSILAMTLAVLLLLPGCGLFGNKDDDLVVSNFDITGSGLTPSQREFEDFLMDYMREPMLDQSVDIHLTFKNHTDFGFPEEYGATWGRPYAYPSDDQIKKDRQRIEYLDSGIHRWALTADQRAVYDLLSYEFESYDQSLALFYYQEPLTAGGGDHVLMPIILGEYKLETELDVKNFIRLCEDFPDYFDHLIAFETEKAASGLFMTNRNREAVQEECSSIASAISRGSLIYSSFTENIKKLSDILSDDEINDYINQMKDAVIDSIVPAYRNLSSKLDGISSRGTVSGIYDTPQGSQYIDYMVRKMGITDGLDEMTATIEKMIPEFYNEAINTPEVLNPNKPKANYTISTIYDYLASAGAADFPALPENTEYTVKYVDPSLKESARSAMYFQPQIDAPQENTIMVNKSRTKDVQTDIASFSVMAHEGFPGHMLQFTTVFAQDFHTLRKALTYSGNYEGWASYVEYYAYKYFPADENDIRFEYCVNMVEWLMRARMDIGVNVHGWTSSDILDFYEFSYPAYAGVYIPEQFEDMRQDMMDHPLRTAPYVLGYLQINKLRARYNASDMDFHKAFLEAGSLPFPLLQSHLDGKLRRVRENDAA